MHETKRRALVLTAEAAGHPFRRSLPAHVLKIAFPAEGDQSLPRPRSRWRLTAADWRGFLTAYCAAFLVVSIFIA